MKCFNHIKIDAIGICINCGRAICRDCCSIFKGKLYCQLCIDNCGSNSSKEKSLTTSQDRVLTLIKNFDYYLNLSKEVIGLDTSWREGVAEHIKVINRIRETNNYEILIQESNFLEDVYNTLISWGMNWRKAELNNFYSFKKTILDNKDLILELKKYELEKLTNAELLRIKELLLEVYSSLDIMKSKAKIVGISKTLAHLIPDLIPPMDRENINYFFYGNKNFPTDIEREKKRFWEIFKKFYSIRNEINISKKDYFFKEFNTSIPKMIDNAIWGYVYKEKKKSKENNKKYYLKFSGLKSENKIPVWQMVNDAVNNLGEKFTNKDINDFIINKYGNINKTTIQCMIYTLTVNYKARINWGFNQRTRIANSKYDLLYKDKNNTLAKYSPEKHGIWEIIKSGNKFIINQISK